MWSLRWASAARGGGATPTGPHERERRRFPAFLPSWSQPLEEWACSPPAVFSAGGWRSAGICWAAEPLRAVQGCRTAGVKGVPVSWASFVGHQTSICCDLGDAQNF